MDPVAALSLACNVMQATQFSLETVQVFRHLKHGVAPDDSAQKNSESLVRTMDRLRAKLSTPAIKHDIPVNSALIETCDEIIRLTDALREQSKKGLPKPTASKFTIFWKSLAYQIVHKDAIAKLAQQLDRTQSRMELEILVDLQTSLRESKDGTADRLGHMDDELQRFYRLLLEGHTRLHDLVEKHTGEIKNAIAEEGERTRQFTDRRVQVVEGIIEAKEKKQIDSAAFQRFVDSFSFPLLNARRSTISDPFEATFEWIFQEPDTSISSELFDRKWDSFPDWLQHGKDPYWISGKAGAGKSTLMKFLFAHDTTRKLLSRNKSDFIVIAAFIWSAGTQLQKNLTGILCTLLQQLFSQCTEMYERVINDTKFAFANYKEPSDWSLSTLKILFSDIVRGSSRPVCIFIDGLDEIDRSKPLEIRSLMEWLDDVSSIIHVKLCVSSRLEDPFERRFSKCCHLRIQDLTANDIGRYVSSSLQELDIRIEISQRELITFVESIVTKAEGVFLWVHLVVEHIRSDAESVSDCADLERRIDELPGGIDSMYETMWNRKHENTKIYRAEAAYYLNALLSWIDKYPTVDLLFIFMMERNEKLQGDILRGNKQISLDMLLREYAQRAARVRNMCGEMVSCRNILPLMEIEKTEDVFDLFFDSGFKLDGPTIDFTHRTARDFLTDTLQGQKILSYDASSAMEHNFLRTRSCLCHAMISGSARYLNLLAIFLMPAVREFEDPVLSSATFDLIIQACQRKPKWRLHLDAMSRECPRIHPQIAGMFYSNGFFEHVEKYLALCPPDYQVWEKSRFMSAVMLWDRNFTPVFQQLEAMSLDDVSYTTSILPYEQLAAQLIDIGPMENLDQSIQNILQKCGGRDSLSTWRVLVAANCDLRLTAFPGFQHALQMPTESFNKFCLFQIVGRKKFVTLTEISMLHAYTGYLGVRDTTPQILLAKSELQNIYITPPPKVVMILELTLDHRSFIADVASKPIRDAATSQLLLTQMEKRPSGNSPPDTQSMNEKNGNGESSDFNTPKEFSLFEIYDQYEE